MLAISGGIRKYEQGGTIIPSNIAIGLKVSTKYAMGLPDGHGGPKRVDTAATQVDVPKHHPKGKVCPSALRVYAGERGLLWRMAVAA